MNKIFHHAPDRISVIANAAKSATFSRFLRDESGASAIEYGLIAALIGVTAMTTLKGSGPKLNARFTAIPTRFD